MNRLFLSAVIFLLTISAAASDKPKEQVCSNTGAVTVEHRDKVTVQTISFLDESPILSGEKREIVKAHVYVPDGDGPFPFILFSHSAIHAHQGTSDLLPYAFGLARAGAASIVLDKTIQWRPYDEAENEDHSVMNCASQWLVENVKFNGHFETMGNYGGYWQGLHSRCTGLPCGGAVGIGWMKSAEQINTEDLLSEKNYLRPAQWLARDLKLALNPEWFHLELRQDTPEMANK
jgi:hypothetical protein